MTPEMERLANTQAARKGLTRRPEGWSRVGDNDWCIKRGDLRIIKLGDGSVQEWRPFPFELWNKKTAECLSCHVTPEEARAAADEWEAKC